MSVPSPWAELQPLAAQIAVGELDGEVAITAIVDAIVRRELATGASPSVAAAIRVEAARAVAADRVLMAMLRPIAAMRAVESVAGDRGADDWTDALPPSRRRADPRASPRRGKVRLAPGVDAPGADAPGADAPGADAPGADAPGADASGDDRGPAAYERAQGGRRLTAIAGVVLGIVAGGGIWWFVLRQTPCESFARQACLELAEPCSSGEIEQHLRVKSIDDAACESARAAAELASSTAGSSKRSRAYEDALVAALGFDPRTGEVPPPRVTAEREALEPMMLARKLPSLPSLVADEAHLYVSSGEAVLRLRSTGGEFEILAPARGATELAVTADFVYWSAPAEGGAALWVDRKRGEYEPATIVTAPAMLGASRCTQGACAYVDTTDGAVWLAAQDGTAPRRLTGPQAPAPTEVWIDGREVAFALPGASGSIAAIATEGGAVRVVAGAESEVRRLGGDDGAWFWIAGGALRTVPRGGGDVATLAPQGVTAYATDTADAYVADGSAIARVPRQSGATTVLVANQLGVEHLVADASAIYWTRGGELFRVPK